MVGAGPHVTRWLFGDQLGPHFLGPPTAPGDDGVEDVLLIETSAAFRRRRYHRAKAHLILSAMRHRAAELGGRCSYVRSEHYASVVQGWPGDLTVVDPTSWAARGLVRRLDIAVLPSRGFVTDETAFDHWARGRSTLRLEDFYRHVRKSTGILMEGAEPVGGAWNFDASNRLPPPRGATTLGLPEPLWPVEDAIDEEVRADLDRWQREGVEFIGADGPRRFAVTRAEALAALEDFLANRLADFGPYEDAALAGDWAMAHSLLSVPLNLGLLHPMEVIDRVVQAGTRGDVPLSSVEGLVRQIMGWRDFVWHLYWHFGEDYVGTSNALDATTPLPEWFRDLDADAVTARCLSTALAEVRERGWNHHILRLMVLGNWALQRGYDPRETTDWFTRSYVDAFPWVMAANVVGMALHADGGRMATKPYAAGGAYVKRMTDFCSGCAYRPDVRVGPRACPVTAGYWAFIDRHHSRWQRHPRMAQPARGLERLADREELVAQEARRGSAAP